MTTTIMRDSIVGDKWIQDTAAAVPIHRVIDPKSGQPTGDIVTGPVRVFFENLFELPPKKPGAQSEPKYGATLAFTPFADFSIMYEEYYKKCAQVFANYYDAQSQTYHGLHSPFHDQAEKARFGGFTPSLVYINTTSKYKPQIVDTNHNPIVDRARVYPGVWAIGVINPYSYGVNPPQPKKGVGFGLQSLMIIGDDKKVAGEGPDTKTLFSNVRNVASPIVRPGIMQGVPTAMPQTAPAAAIPGYTAPGGGVQTAGGMVPPAIPQQHYVPQGQPPMMPPQFGGQGAPAQGDDESWMH